jgi:hypothetical protein
MTEPEMLDKPPEFSLVLGGPVFHFFRRARLSGHEMELVRRRVMVIAGMTSLPLLLLASLSSGSIISANRCCASRLALALACV